MSMISDLRTRLLAVTAVASAVGTRIGRFERPRGKGTATEFPAVRLTVKAPGRDYSHDGPTGLDRALVQIDVWHLTADAVDPLFVAIRDALEGQTPVVAGATRFHPAMLTNGSDAEPEDIADGKRVFRIRGDFEFYHEAV